MRTMANLVKDITSLNTNDLEMLAEGLAWFRAGASNQAEKLEFFLNIHNREQKAKFDRLRNNIMKGIS